MNNSRFKRAAQGNLGRVVFPAIFLSTFPVWLVSVWFIFLTLALLFLALAVLWIIKI